MRYQDEFKAAEDSIAVLTRQQTDSQTATIVRNLLSVVTNPNVDINIRLNAEKSLANFPTDPAVIQHNRAKARQLRAAEMRAEIIALKQSGLLKTEPVTPEPTEAPTKQLTAMERLRAKSGLKVAPTPVPAAAPAAPAASAPASVPSLRRIGDDIVIAPSDRALAESLGWTIAGTVQQEPGVIFFKVIRAA